jgi:hypothetical protein
VPLACQIAWRTTGNSGDSPWGDPDSNTAPPHFSTAAGPERPKLPKLRAHADSRHPTRPPGRRLRGFFVVRNAGRVSHHRALSATDCATSRHA